MNYVKGAIKNALGEGKEISPEMIEEIVNPQSVEGTAEKIMESKNYKKLQRKPSLELSLLFLKQESV